MNCTETKGKMEPYASGSLAPAERALVEEHLTRCEGCRLEMELVRAMGSSPAPAATQGGAGASEWTLDRIFGAGERPRSGAADAAAPEPTAAQGATPAEAEEAESGISGDAGLVSEPRPAETSAGERETTAVEAESAFEVSAFEAGTPGGTQVVGAASDPPASRVDLDQLGSGADAAEGGPAHSPGGSATERAGAPHSYASRQTEAAPTSWDFEPADAKAAPKPPDGSLFFAEETLERQREIESRKKGGPLRLVLWGLAALVGVVFLALSAWIALHARQAPEEVAVRRAGAPTGTSAPAAPAPEAETLAPEAPAQSAPEVEEPASGDVASGGESVPPAAVETPPPAPEEIAPAGAHEESVVEPRPAASRPAEKASRRRPRAPTPAPKPERTPSRAGTTARAPSITPSPSGAIPKTPVPVPSTAPPERDLSEMTDAPESTEPDAERPRAPQPETPAPTVAKLERHSAPAEGAPAGTQPAPSAPAPTPSAAAPEASPPAIERPIDRIHQATVLAEERGDLNALRQLRNTWKNMIQKTGVGPDRMRAKREYADCLWGIQTLTGRAGDQKAALIAYRDYLLNAPAGGADSRSVGRTRLLEDALSESR